MNLTFHDWQMGILNLIIGCLHNLLRVIDNGAIDSFGTGLLPAAWLTVAMQIFPVVR
jgi:hypothetical protein